jgi:hypothetical protein
MRTLPVVSAHHDPGAVDTQETPILLPQAIAWAEQQAAEVARTGQVLNDSGLELARQVGVSQPDRIRVAVVDTLPMPDDPVLQAAAIQTGLLGPGMVGLTPGYAVFICRGHETVRLFSHEFRHVHQYEQSGSIAELLPGYLLQILQFGYANAPSEQDAKAHERNDL